MEITDIRVFPVDEEKLKAYVTIVFDRCFMVSDIKVINGNNGLFVSMPSKRRKNGTYRDVAHPLNSETRRMIEERILVKYEEVLAVGSTPRRVRRPREAQPADLPQPRAAGARSSVSGHDASDPSHPDAPGF
ncbi:MAG: septation regulator SpoVG [Acidobacteriota bacterium]|nr:MAG: septation regulator SpoVG [Acidobacteriota bacterium]